jgi:Wiskott-Aldrich syndrome protein
MYERLPNAALPPTPPGGYDAPSPSIPYMPSTDPRGAAAPIPPPPRPAAPARPRLPVMAGMPSEADMQFQPARPDTFGGLSPADMAAMAAPAPVPSPVMDPIGPPPARPIAARGRPSPADLARALRESDERFARSTAQR